MTRASAAALCLLFLACGADEPTTVDRASSCEIAGSLPLARRLELDLVFVVDRSAAMAPLRDALAANARGFDALLDLRDGRPSLHVAVLPADGGGSFACQGDTRATFDCIAGLGATGGAPAPLAALEQALANPENARFRRPEAWLAVVVIAAQDDTSPDEPGAYVARLGRGVSLAAIVDPAASPRLASYAGAAHQYGVVVPLAAADWSDGLTWLVRGQTITELSAFCLAPGATSCVATLTAATTGAAEVLRRCTATTPRPCWSLVAQPLCGDALAQEIRLERDEVPTYPTFLELRCAVPCDGR